jgi:hypothetical protein
MAISDHVAILTHHALAAAQPNRKKAGNPLQFYALLAFAPDAANDLQAIAKQVAPGGSLNGLKVGVRRNSQLDKPVPGVPADWFIIRAATQFPPYLADEGGNQLDQATHTADIRVKFYAGKKVRAALSAYYWPNEGGGISFNLDGVMAVSDGERLNIGNTAANAFAGYADMNVVKQEPAASPSGSAATGASSGSTAADPFQQSTKPATANPFA